MSDIPIREMKGHDILAVERFRDSTCRMIEFVVRKQGKETIDMYNTSVTKGTQESHGQNFQKLGKELASVDELAVLDGSKCILQLRGVRPFLSDKYDITKHPNYK